MLRAAKLKRALQLLLCIAVILLFTGCADEQADDEEYQQEEPAEEDLEEEEAKEETDPPEEEEYLFEVDEKETDDFLVTTTRVDDKYLDYKAESLDLPRSANPQRLHFAAGTNSFALAMPDDNSDSYDLYFWDSEGLEPMAELTFEPPSFPESSILENLRDDYYIYIDTNATYLVRAGGDGIDEIGSFDLSGRSWDLNHASEWRYFHPESGEDEELEEEEWQDEWFSPDLVDIKLTPVGDYLIAYFGYSSRLFGEFLVPPILEEPYFEVYKLEEDGLELITDEVFKSSYFTTDVKALSENKAIVATSDEGFILLDLDDFSYSILEVGGEHLDDDYSPIKGLYEAMVSHSFIETIGEEAFLTRTFLSVPVMHCGMIGDIQLWIASGDGYELAAETTIGERNMLMEDDYFNFINAAGEYWAEREGLFSFDREKASNTEDIPGNDYPAISHYYENKLNLSGIPEEVLGEELGGYISLWSLDEQNEFTRYRLAASWGSKLIDIEPGQVDVFSVEGDANLPIEHDRSTRTSYPSGIDTENEQLFFFTEENIYILDMDQVFGE